MNLRIKKVKSKAVIPSYQTSGAAGMDLSACIEESVVLAAGKQVIIPTGVALEIPEGYEVQLRGRSGLAAKHGVGLTNGIGTIDSDYRGEINVILMNWGSEPFEVTSGMRIAQMVVAKYEKVTLELVDELAATDRGEKKFGSTGTRV